MADDKSDQSEPEPTPPRDPVKPETRGEPRPPRDPVIVKTYSEDDDNTKRVIRLNED